jgi:hypothetical protein
VAITGSEAVYNTHRWFERNSGWAPPDPGTLAEWMADGVCRCPDECEVAPPVPCRHGLASWWLVLRCLDRPAQVGPIPPAVLVPHPGRLDPDRPDYVAIIDAHHEALERGASGYSDPGTGLFVQTARTLWDRGGCCEQGCRHCPFLSRGRFEG